VLFYVLLYTCFVWFVFEYVCDMLLGLGLIDLIVRFVVVCCFFIVFYVFYLCIVFFLCLFLFILFFVDCFIFVSFYCGFGLIGWVGFVWFVCLLNWGFALCFIVWLYFMLVYDYFVYLYCLLSGWGLGCFGLVLGFVRGWYNIGCGFGIL